MMHITIVSTIISSCIICHLLALQLLANPEFKQSIPDLPKW